MNLKLISLTLGTALALGESLSAQENTPRWSAGVSVGMGTDSLAAVTNVGTNWWSIGAYNLDFGYAGMIANSGVPFRASVGINHLPAGNEGLGPAHTIASTSPIKNSFFGYYVGADIFLNSIVVDNLYIILGMSVNQWTLHQKNGYDEVLNPATGLNTLVRAIGKSESYSIKGPKFGGRIGIEYKFSDKLAFDMVLQLNELGHNRSHFVEDPSSGTTFITGNRTWNASWLQLGVKYSF